MLADLLGSKTRARLIEALLKAPGKQLHLRALVRQVGTSISSVQRELERLSEMGLVESTRDSAGRRQIRLLEAHPYAGPLASLVAAEPQATYAPCATRVGGIPDETLQALNPRIRPLVPAIVSAAADYATTYLSLFGSATQAEPSVVPRDLDVAVRFDARDPRPASDLYFGLTDELKRVSGLPVDLVELDAIRNPYLRESIELTGVVLHEEP